MGALFPMSGYQRIDCKVGATLVPSFLTTRDGDLLDFRTRVAFETATTSVRLTGPSSGPAAQLQLQILAGL